MVRAFEVQVDQRATGTKYEVKTKDMVLLRAYASDIVGVCQLQTSTVNDVKAALKKPAWESRIFEAILDPGAFLEVFNESLGDDLPGRSRGVGSFQARLSVAIYIGLELVEP